MFNLSKKAQHGHPQQVPQQFVEQQAQHSQRIKNRSQALSEDAKHFALRMYREQIEKPSDVISTLDSVPYWQYVKKFDPKYIKELANLIPEVLKDIKHNPNAYIPAQPPPKPQGAQGGAPGGAPPPGGGGAPPPGGAPGGAPPPGGGGLGAPMAPTAFNAKRRKTASLNWEAFVLGDGTVVVEKKQGK